MFPTPGPFEVCAAAVPCNVPGPATATLLAPATFLSLPRQRPWPLQRLLVPVQRQRHKSCPGTILDRCNCCCWSHRTLLDRCSCCCRGHRTLLDRCSCCCCWGHRTLLQGCWTLQQVQLEPLDAPARLLNAETGAAGATGRSCKAAGLRNRCCWSSRTFLQGCWTLQQVLLELQDAPARLLNAETGAAGATGRSCKAAER